MILINSFKLLFLTQRYRACKVPNICDNKISDFIRSIGINKISLCVDLKYI